MGRTTRTGKGTKKEVMRAIQLEYDINNCRVVSQPECGDYLAFYTDELQVPDKVIYHVVDIYNEGCNLTVIDGYLMNNELITQDDRETIVEGLYSIKDSKL